ncbi:hypothetical protein BpHYR1_037791 [Brachionus plicatilis]|uniref:Uncharacterized protein n=1 Tax=Brachionus plicatilis TaxID=10195 RepID=A0A3M7PAA2_BRAPC|nr:hypothetical protein BpHYR1_037791 [Brachionus plicatilis]
MNVWHALRAQPKTLGLMFDQIHTDFGLLECKDRHRLAWRSDLNCELTGISYYRDLIWVIKQSFNVTCIDKNNAYYLL